MEGWDVSFFKKRKEQARCGYYRSTRIAVVWMNRNTISSVACYCCELHTAPHQTYQSCYIIINGMQQQVKIQHTLVYLYLSSSKYELDTVVPWMDYLPRVINNIPDELYHYPLSFLTKMGVKGTNVWKLRTRVYVEITRLTVVRAECLQWRLGVTI